MIKVKSERYTICTSVTMTLLGVEVRFLSCYDNKPKQQRNGRYTR
jgi:hypothetical protein